MLHRCWTHHEIATRRRGSPGGYFFIEKQALYVKNMSYYYPWGRNGEHVKLGEQVPHFSRGRADPGAK